MPERKRKHRLSHMSTLGDQSEGKYLERFASVLSPILTR
jgi:hypothetical protein